MRIAFLIFDDLTTLDAIGPFEVLCRIPGAEVMFVGETTDIKRADPKLLAIGRRLLDRRRDQRRRRSSHNEPSEKLQPVVGAGVCTPLASILC